MGDVGVRCVREVLEEERRWVGVVGIDWRNEVANQVPKMVLLRKNRQQTDGPSNEYGTN